MVEVCCYYCGLLGALLLLFIQYLYIFAGSLILKMTARDNFVTHTIMRSLKSIMYVLRSSNKQKILYNMCIF
jgi:hypothetical protein